MMNNKRNVKWIIAQTSYGTKVMTGRALLLLLERLEHNHYWHESFAFEIVSKKEILEYEIPTIVHVWFDDIKPVGEKNIWLFTPGKHISEYKNAFYTCPGIHTENRLRLAGVAPWKIFKLPMNFFSTVLESDIERAVESLMNIYNYLFSVVLFSNFQ